MRILLLTSEVWNDELYPNNNMSNWFSGFKDVEVANIYSSPGTPLNNCCKKYFQFTEKMMLKSIFGKCKAGKKVVFNDFPHTYSKLDKTEKLSHKEKKMYAVLRSFSSEAVRLLRDIIWSLGRFNYSELKSFIDEFNPDVIFTQRKASIKMCRIERLVLSLCDAPMVAYTGDDEYSLKQFSLSPIFWMRLFWLRKKLRKNIPNYKIFYSQSKEQMKNFREEFNSNTKFLVKCGDFLKSNVHTSVGEPINLVYAGKLYCNRWKTLSMLADCIREVNKNGIKFVLNIYTKDHVTKKQKMRLSDGVNSFIREPVSASELKKVFEKADIALHVEGFDLKNKLLVKYSFSTKIMECLSSGCAVMAICDENQAGYIYLKQENAAFVATDKQGVIDILTKISNSPDLIVKFSNSAFECGVRNHQRDCIQKKLLEDFSGILNN